MYVFCRSCEDGPDGKIIDNFMDLTLVGGRLPSNVIPKSRAPITVGPCSILRNVSREGKLSTTFRLLR